MTYICEVCGRELDYRKFKGMNNLNEKAICCDCQKAARERMREFAKPWYLQSYEIHRTYKPRKK